MLYNTDVHLPQIVEYLMTDYRSGEMEKLESSKTMILKLIPEIKDNLDLTEKSYLVKQKKITEDCYNSIKEEFEVNKGKETLEEFLSIINKSYKDFVDLENDNWETIISKIVKHIKTTDSNVKE